MPHAPPSGRQTGSAADLVNHPAAAPKGAALPQRPSDPDRADPLRQALLGLFQSAPESRSGTVSPPGASDAQSGQQ